VLEYLNETLERKLELFALLMKEAGTRTQSDGSTFWMPNVAFLAGLGLKPALYTETRRGYAGNASVKALCQGIRLEYGQEVWAKSLDKRIELVVDRINGFVSVVVLGEVVEVGKGEKEETWREKRAVGETEIEDGGMASADTRSWKLERQRKKGLKRKDGAR
jgi:hypothetical protein